MVATVTIVFVVPIEVWFVVSTNWANIYLVIVIVVVVVPSTFSSTFSTTTIPTIVVVVVVVVVVVGSCEAWNNWCPKSPEGTGTRVYRMENHQEDDENGAKTPKTHPETLSNWAPDDKSLTFLQLPFIWWECCMFGKHDPAVRGRVNASYWKT